METILLTGSTGILGREILYQLLKEMMSGKAMHLLLPVRSLPDKSALDRLLEVLNAPDKPHYLSAYPSEQFLTGIEVIDTDLAVHDPHAISQIKKYKNIYLIHNASNTNLYYDNKALLEVYENNYLATLRLLEQLTGHIRKFIFISTAYCTGLLKGLVKNEYHDFDEAGRLYPMGLHKQQRNHYEYYKLLTEHEIIHYCNKKGISWQILRPSMIGGRLLDAPLYRIARYNVFYLMGICLYKWRMESPDQTSPHIRIFANPDMPLNIVPVDYLAAAIVHLRTDDDVTEANTVSSKGIPLHYGLSVLIHPWDISFDITREIPTDPNHLETFFYSKIGAWMAEYLQLPVHEFDTSLLRQKIAHIPEPDMIASFAALYDYAVKSEFGRVKNPV
ncbi:SDR family oxidoreductase [Chitinophaga nivalis]|uniref:SDR family oxidoreductase n=1 Tax=Chitinophaga nivalis TaxID=2991709 RepID=A0ABT3IIM6_9BACT|nr:SDR family oxidoreductase [Chitinophaga nivalis]MCW3466654.1 SDR family oxidoreductase [Chitinophaga nivalis]MCW3483655.1 SDR family oxidoreductase [Chitinophaga nivalis]